MRRDDGPGCLLAIVEIVGLLAVFQIGHCEGEESTRNKAVKHGAAEWVATPDGQVEFRWRTPAQAEGREP